MATVYLPVQETIQDMTSAERAEAAGWFPSEPI